MVRLGGGRWMPSSAVFLKARLALVFPPIPSAAIASHCKRYRQRSLRPLQSRRIERRSRWHYCRTKHTLRSS
ncbi:uncharacterized protein SCHCODRAFT_02260304 [Schizophyllum commune H4-8]|uniref:uncharacterized protein n=1 Tax=Schizophyllum commune (strain H4-8 / FGSC 9210) TaxID=578458 RepID=UPI002160840B|nr:uncharacterized protein SCHCODRAFT_02260304 [Schizophyllum commune H4-8]KAI5893753.1 hypothetical protein SCHCODRAFT_02260304 [Schizophyllum commune H4-8]